MTLTFVPKMIAVMREGAEFFRFPRERRAAAR
jgi:flagellar biosynthesis protein FliQ